MIKKGDICIINKHGKADTRQAIRESVGLRVKVTEVFDAMCWIKILDGEHAHYELPCLKEKITKLEVEA